MTSRDPSGWTTRERGLLAAIAGGASAADLAAADRLPVPQVRAEVRALRTRLGARTNVQAVVEAVRRGVI